ncbi:MAG TPA: response regulator transcription factor [Terriglobia bacterium]|nr:response regulator transcription factor [Terriglobia bacterium]
MCEAVSAGVSGLVDGTPVQVLLTEAFPKALRELSHLLSSQGFHMIAEVTDNRNAVRLVKHFMPDIAILDAAGKFSAGLKAAKEILIWNQKARIILLSLHAENQYKRAALQAGVRGYVLKTRAASDLAQAVREVSRGGIYLSPAGSSRHSMEHMLGNE